MKSGAQKHSTETIQKAITKYESGARLSAIARELGVRKSTVKYWLDHASKFIQDAPGTSPVLARIQNRLTRETWDIIFAALKVLRGKLEQAPVRDLVAVVSELFDRQGQFGSLTGRTGVPEKVMEKSEEIRITVQKYLQKQKPTVDEKEAPAILGDAPPEPLQDVTTTVEVAAPALVVEEANRAT